MPNAATRPSGISEGGDDDGDHTELGAALIALLLLCFVPGTVWHRRGREQRGTGNDAANIGVNAANPAFCGVPGSRALANELYGMPESPPRPGQQKPAFVELDGATRGTAYCKFAWFDSGNGRDHTYAELDADDDGRARGGAIQNPIYSDLPVGDACSRGGGLKTPNYAELSAPCDGTARGGAISTPKYSELPVGDACSRGGAIGNPIYAKRDARNGRCRDSGISNPSYVAGDHSAALPAGRTQLAGGSAPDELATQIVDANLDAYGNVDLVFDPFSRVSELKL